MNQRELFWSTFEVNCTVCVQKSILCDAGTLWLSWDLLVLGRLEGNGMMFLKCSFISYINWVTEKGLKYSFFWRNKDIVSFQNSTHFCPSITMRSKHLLYRPISNTSFRGRYSTLCFPFPIALTMAIKNCPRFFFLHNKFYAKSLSQDACIFSWKNE